VGQLLLEKSAQHLAFIDRQPVAVDDGTVEPLRSRLRSRLVHPLDRLRRWPAPRGPLRKRRAHKCIPLGGSTTIDLLPPFFRLCGDLPFPLTPPEVSSGFLLALCVQPALLLRSLLLRHLGLDGSEPSCQQVALGV